MESINNFFDWITIDRKWRETDKETLPQRWILYIENIQDINVCHKNVDQGVDKTAVLLDSVVELSCDRLLQTKRNGKRQGY